MRFLTLFLLAAVAASCTTAKRCARKFPPVVEIRDSVYVRDTTIVVHDTITLPGSLLTIRDTVPCDSLGRANLNKRTVRAGRATATVEINKGVLTVECAEDSLRAVITKLERFRDTWRGHTEWIVQKEYITRRIDIVCRWIAGIFSFLFVIFIFRSIRHIVRRQ